MNGTGDAALLAAFRAGRPDAFDEIVRRHYATLLRVARVRCGGLAEDAVQAALVRAHRYLRTAAAVNNVGAWLRRVVLNCANDALRAELRDVPPAEADKPRDVPLHRVLEARELQEIVRAGIRRLPELYRRPLEMHYLLDMDAREIAEELRDNLNSVKSRLARGRRELRRRLEGRLERGGYL